jgi:hypothetical protein
MLMIGSYFAGAGILYMAPESVSNWDSKEILRTRQVINITILLHIIFINNIL